MHFNVCVGVQLYATVVKANQVAGSCYQADTSMHVWVHYMLLRHAL